MIKNQSQNQLIHMSIAILLPTLNEEASIGSVIDEVKEAGGDGWGVVVVDSGSKDRTVEIALAKGAAVIRLPMRGKGIAVRKAFREIDADYLVMIDSDRSYRPEDIRKILEKLGECDVVVGSRFKGTIEKGAMPFTNRIGNLGLNLLAGVLYGKNVSDVCSGMWGFRRATYKKFDIDAKHFELEANFFVEAVHRNLGFCEIPIGYRVREGVSKLGILDGVAIGLYLIRKFISRR